MKKLETLLDEIKANEGGILTENGAILFDRCCKIQAMVRQHGQEKFYISFSGGKDSTVIHYLFDFALGRENTIPRVYANTGIDYKISKDFVFDLASKDPRFQIIAPTVKIRRCLEEEGYPMVSKEHSLYVSVAKNSKEKGVKSATVERYLFPAEERKSWGCRPILRYQVENPDSVPFKISDKCCLRMKEEPLRKWAKENCRSIAVIGIMRAEGGRRNRANCVVTDKNGDIKAFQPLSVVSKEWEEWFIKTFGVELNRLYSLGLKRTGCVGCPLDPHLEKTLQHLEEIGLYYEVQRAESVWAKPYAEYRKIGYRLTNPPIKERGHQLTLFELIQ